jgi:hypothetical protein
MSDACKRGFWPCNSEVLESGEFEEFLMWFPLCSGFRSRCEDTPAVTCVSDPLEVSSSSLCLIFGDILDIRIDAKFAASFRFGQPPEEVVCLRNTCREVLAGFSDICEVGPGMHEG